jgi:hypothetical protein
VTRHRLLLLALLTLAPRAAAAQLTLQPSILTMDASTSAQRRTVRLANEGREAEQLRFYAQDFAQDSTGAYTFGAPGAMAGSCGGRLALSPSSATLAPGQAQELVVELAPGSAACWAMITAETVARRTDRAMIGLRLGAKLHVSPGGAARELSVTRTTAETRGDSVHVSILMNNPGAVPVVVSGRLELRPLAGASAPAAVPVAPLGVLPGTRRRVVVSVPRPARGEYAAVVVLDYGAEDLAGGQALVSIP